MLNFCRTNRSDRCRRGRRVLTAWRAGIVMLAGLGFGVSAYLPAQAADLADVCSPAGALPVHIVAVGPGFELVAADGRHFLLVGIDPAPLPATDSVLAEEDRQAVATWLAGHDVAVRPIAATPDRWGRVPAAIFAPADFDAHPAAPSISVAEALIDAGFARAEPEVLSMACAPALLRAEAAARAGKLGLWADSGNAVIPAAAADRLAADTGSRVIAEGRVLSVGSSASRYYLNFGPKGTDDLFVSISRRDAAKFARAGLPLASLTGSLLRVRGILEDRFGPEIEIAAPQAVERLDPGPPASSPVAGQAPGRSQQGGEPL